MKNYFKIPTLKEGLLCSKDALSIYEYYLTTNMIGDDGVAYKPTRASIVTAMLACHNPTSINIIQDYLDAGKKVLFWSDQHFGHQNIITYSNRPFEDKAVMDNTMISNYLNTVGIEDLVVWGGDVAFSSVEQNRNLFSQLPGKKVLIVGNHDFDRKGKFKDYDIFDYVFMSQVFHLKVGDKICNIILSHYPIPNSLLPENTLNVHGHIHDKLAAAKSINISVEHTSYRPIDILPIIYEKFSES